MSLGQNIEVRTNAFRITNLPPIKYYQYDVIQPELRNVRRRNELITRMQDISYPQLFQSNCIYDGRAILYAPMRLGFQGGTTGTLEVSLGNGPRDNYQVKLTLAGRPIDFQELGRLVTTPGGRITPEIKIGINLLQMILRNAAAQIFASKGRSVFTEQARPLDLTLGVCLLSGFFQSVRPMQRSVIVNVDISNAAFYKHGPLSSLALEVLTKYSRNSRVLSTTSVDEDGPAIISILKHHFYKVLIRVPAVSKTRIRTIRGIKENAGNYRFTKNAGEGQEMDVEVTVAEYYSAVYNITIRNPRDFGVIVSLPGQPLQLVPFELCEVIPGQPFKRKLDENQTRLMVKHTTRGPAERLDRICAAVAPGGTLQFTNSRYITRAELQLEHEPMAISGTLMAPPAVRYGGQQSMQPNNGSWNMLGKTVHSAAGLGEPWLVLNFGELSDNNVGIFVRALHDCCTKLVLGMNMVPPDPNRYARTNPQKKDLRKTIAELSPRGPPRFILVILKKSDADNKARLKQLTDAGEHPIITQCVREDKFSANLASNNARKLNQYCNNVALKINARLGGVNYATPLPGLDKSVQMIIGLDVSHPPGGPRLDRPSVASLVFSTDQNGCRYQARYSVLRPRTEALGEDLRVMVKSAITTFVSINKRPPTSIVCYRDGVSEDEYERTAASEIEVMEHAVKEQLEELAKERGLGMPPVPKLTFIVVTKRHHFGAFAMDQRHADRSGNLLPGFVTNDSTSTPGLSEFYLLSHGGLLGTSRPAHYIVLKDDNFGFKLDIIKKLSFALCHVYAKATRSVSIPAPVYYADLACLRATTYYFDASLRFDGDDASTVDGNPKSNRQLRDDFNLARWQQGFHHPVPKMQQAMYFL